MAIDTTAMRERTQKLLDGTTPGPWEVGPFSSTQVSRERFRGICSTGGFQDNRDMSWRVFAENEANARFVAAAPELAADHLRLCDQVDQLRAENERLRAALSEMVRLAHEEQWEANFDNGKHEQALSRAQKSARAALKGGRE